MSDIRLKEMPFEYDGKKFILRCNMNVLADIQEQNGGTIPDIFEQKKSLKNFTLYLAAMMNDYADEQGWDERYTARQLGRKISMTDGTLISNVMKLVISSIYVQKDNDEETEPTESKN